MSLLDYLMGGSRTGMSPQSQIQTVMNRPNPTGLTPQEQVQAVAGSRMMPAPTSRGTPSFVAGRDAAPAQQPSLLSQIGGGIKNYLSDPVNRKQLALGFNAMRLNPDANFARSLQSQIETEQGNRQLGKNTKAYVDYLLSKGLITREQAAQMMSSPKMAEALASAAITRDFSAPKETFTAVSGSDLVARGYNVDPSKTYNISSTGKITQVGGGGVNVNLGDDAVSKEYAKQIPEALGQYSDRGAAANRQNSALNNLGRALSGVDTGGFAETKQTILSFADRLGIPVDTESLADAQQLQAAARQIVADELRQNKGPQTDFDARFAETYLPGLGQQPEANENILSYLKSRNLLDSIYGRLSAGRNYEFDSDKKLLSRLNAFNSTLGATVQVDEEWFTFEEFYREAKNRGGSDMDILNEWSKLH